MTEQPMGDNNLPFHPFANIFPLMEGEEFDALVASIRDSGQREPIWLYESKILDGRNRYRACREVGVEPRFETFEGSDPLTFVVDLNLRRRHLNESQRAMVAARLATLQHGQRADHARAANLPVLDQSEAAALLNVSDRSVRSAAVVRDNAVPELSGKVEAGAVSVSAAADVARLPEAEQREIVARGEKEILEAAKAIRIEKARQRSAELAIVASQKPPPPEGRYSVIVIDPPWPMLKIGRDVRPNQVEFEYPTMTEDELREFGSIVSDMAADDCHLFLWTTQKFLPMGFRLLEAWGFKYVLEMVWRKSGGFQPIGLPQYNCEFVLYARRGSPSFVDTKAFDCCFDAPRREHSRKPDYFYDLVRRVTDGPRIDVFSREKRNGFDQYGNEADKFAKADVA